MFTHVTLIRRIIISVFLISSPLHVLAAEKIWDSELRS